MFLFLTVITDPILPAGFEPFEFLDKEGLQNLGTLVEGRVAGVVVAAVVEDFGHVRHKLCQLDVLALLQPLLHGGKVCAPEIRDGALLNTIQLFANRQKHHMHSRKEKHFWQGKVNEDLAVQIFLIDFASRNLHTCFKVIAAYVACA